MRGQVHTGDQDIDAKDDTVGNMFLVTHGAAPSMAEVAQSFGKVADLSKDKKTKQNSLV